jgi:homogentisate 1,2-dioxygenase
MPPYIRRGDVPHKRHSVHMGPSGRLSEELMGQSGFSGASSLLYHSHSPSALVRADAAEVFRCDPEPNAALLPYHFRLGSLAAGDDPVGGRHVLMGNRDVTVCWVGSNHSSDLYRDAAGDELVYVFSGHGLLESVFGNLPVGEGDYVVIPASTTHRWVIDPSDRLELLVLESTGHIGIPARYLTDTGQLKEGAPFSERDLRGPEGPHTTEGTEVPVLVKHRGGWARHVYENHPFDVVAWDGCVYPFAFSIRDFEPIAGRVHQPPPVHQTFAGPGFVVCSFVPRLLDFGENAVRVPYHHANTDSDEVLFYVGGDFTSRSGAGIGPKSVTLHPAGFVHGPQPGSYEASISATSTNETAVMLDTFSPLGVSNTARGVADAAYVTSWANRLSS